MKKSNLIKLLSSLDHDEIRNLSEFVSSPYFNKNKNVIKLFEYLRKQYPAFREESVNKKNILLKILPHAKNNDGYLRVLMFTLTNLIYDFLKYQEYDKNPVNGKITKLKAFNSRRLDSNFSKLSRQVLNDLKSGSLKDKNYYYNSYLFEFENLYNIHRKYFGRIEKFIDDKGVDKILHSLNCFYVAGVLKFYIYIINTRQLYNIDIDTAQFEIILNNFNLSQYKNDPLIKAFYHTIKLQTDENNQTNFELLKKEVFSNYSAFNSEDSVELLINLENYCKKQTRNGKAKYIKELFEIYKFEIENKTYLSEGGLTEQMYIGITETAIKLNELKWIEKFIHEYKKELPADLRPNALLYSTALLEFAKGNFTGTLKILSGIKYGEVFNKFAIKTLQIECCYELNMFDQMEAVIDSYRHLLSSNRYISAERKPFLKNFINVSRKLIRLKNSYTPALAAEIRSTLKQKGFVIEMHWIENKISEAEKRFSK